MKIQIWSDVMCPFCYIGKKNFETALAKFPHRDQVVVEWKSFELDPIAPKNPMASMVRTLAAKYKKTLPEAQAMVDQVALTAKHAGLQLNLSKAIPTNSLDAHRLVHLAAKHGKQGEAKEMLFAAFLIHGEDLARVETLMKFGKQLGLPTAEVDRLFSTDEFLEDVRKDENEAFHLQIRGVPYFQMDKRFAVSGAQPVEHFAKALQQVWEKHSAK